MIPLNAIRVFEVVSRHLSMSSAARELFVTQGAVSQQIKGLEEYLNVRLFVRRRDGLMLTAIGRHFFQAISPALATLQVATKAVRRSATEGPVVVSTLSSVANRWLLPHLSGFLRETEGEVRIDVTRRLVNLQREGVDLAIRYGSGEWHGLAAEELFPLEIVCVAAPGVAVPADLHMDGQGVRLLLDPGLLNWVRTAFDLAHVDVDPMVQRAVTFDDLNALIQASVSGHGAAFAPLFLVVHDLSEGRLQLCTKMLLSLDGGYWLCRPAGSPLRDTARRLDLWIKKEATGTRDCIRQFAVSAGLQRQTVAAAGPRRGPRHG